ncbi:PE domain-containing protein [Actinophytocola sediminis]
MYIDTGAEAPSGPARMIVTPDNLLRLKQGLEEERDRIRTWRRTEGRDVAEIDPPGNDPCSKDTMFWMSQNGQDAVNAVDAYVDRLTAIVENLHDSAVSYGLIEADNAHTFRQEPA